MQTSSYNREIEIRLQETKLGLLWAQLSTLASCIKKSNTTREYAEVTRIITDGEERWIEKLKRRLFKIERVLWLRDKKLQDTDRADQSKEEGKEKFAYKADIWQRCAYQLSKWKSWWAR